jgi:hypothetical protein
MASFEKTGGASAASAGARGDAVMNCGCNSLGAARRRRLGDAPLAVTVTPEPCPWGFNIANRKPTFIETTKHNLCLATHRAGQLILDAGHWIWAKLQGLWNAFRTALNNIGAVARRVVQGGLTMLQGVAAEVQKLLQWLDDQAAHVLNWFIWVGIAAAGVWLTHDYLVRPQAPPAPVKAAA